MLQSETDPQLHHQGKSSTNTIGDRRDDFVRYYLIHQNAARAYREAGYKDGPGTRQSAHRLLTSAYISDRITDAREVHLAKLDVKVENVLDKLRAIAFGDPAAITEYIIGACRYCHGIDHQYHWRHEDELVAHNEDQTRKADRTRKLARIDRGLGGFGYSRNAVPHPNCPNCDGDGVGRARFKNTRMMTRDERMLLAWVKETRQGVEFVMNDQVAALKALAKRLGFYNVKREDDNAVASLIADLKSSDLVERMPLRIDEA